MFCELFLRGDTDPDWHYLLKGVIFGFRVINSDYDANYCPKLRGIRNPSHKEGISNNLSTELRQGCISVVTEKPTCAHDIFWVPKDHSRGGRTIVDCSRPKCESVNNFSDQVCYNITEVMERGVVMSTINIKDAYRAVSIHPEDHWEFDSDSSCTYMHDNMLCRGLASRPYIFSKISDFIVR